MSIIEYSQDLTNAEQPPLLPPGPYPAEIIGAMEKVSKTNGHKYLNVTARINAESYPADYTDGDPEGVELQYNFIQLDDSPRNRFQMRRFLERVGAPLSRRVDLNELIGRTMTVDVVHNEWNDEQRLQIARILAP
jgi:hypothetical protein